MPDVIEIPLGRDVAEQYARRLEHWDHDGECALFSRDLHRIVAVIRSGGIYWRSSVDHEIVTAYLSGAGGDPEPSAKPVVYFVQAETSQLIKIGWSARLANRIAALRTGSPERLTVLKTIPGDCQLESEIHQRFRHLRHHGEWFKPGDDLLAFIGEAQ